MKIDELISCIYQLGFGEYKLRNTNTKKYPFLDMKGIGLVYIEVAEEIDYYTSWYGNHPSKYLITFVNEDKFFSKELSHIKNTNELIGYIDDIFEKYRKESSWTKYNNNKKSILREKKLSDLLTNK